MHAVTLISADLGAAVAAIHVIVRRQPVVVVNTRARADPRMKSQALGALLCVGVDAAHAMETVSNGVSGKTR